MKNKNPEGQLDFLSLLTEHKETPELSFFKECGECWCRDCRHNSKGEAVPRDLCGKEMPCPACEGCISENRATVCVIGAAKEGCMTRALEEGIAP
ncbi:MAG: hypothetical protein K6E19_09315 [Lachnospiraceae bacterium]|nr:hypothetical protein [Lachnospiraceae bacterium]